MLTKSLLGIALLVPLVTLADEGKPSVFVDLKGKGQFDLLFDRAQSTATGAAVGGLIGAGVEAAVRSGRDEEKMEQLQPFLSIESCEEALLSAFEEKLSQKGYDVGTETGSNPEAIAIELDIKECGFKVVDSQTLSMAAFISFETHTEDKELLSLNEESFHFYGKDRYHFDGLVKMKHAVNHVHEKVFQRAGVRLANKIIYR